MSRIITKLRQLHIHVSPLLSTSSHYSYSRPRFYSDESKDKTGDGKDKVNEEKVKSEIKEKKIEAKDVKADVETKDSKELVESEEWVPLEHRDVSKLAPWEDGYDTAKDPRWPIQGLVGFKYPSMFIRERKEKTLTLEKAKAELELLKEGRMSRRKDELFPYQADYIIFGGGIMGASIAYWLKERVARSVDVLVIEKDPTYSQCSTTLSVGGIRQQFSLPENIEMSMFSADFLRNARSFLGVLDQDPPDVSFHHQGYLMMATESGVEKLIENHKTQTDMGAYVDILLPEQIKEKFPWINTDGIALATYGVQNEGWFDPFALLIGMRTKAECLGARFLHAEVVDFNVKTMVNRGMKDDSGGDGQKVNQVIIKMADGTYRQIDFAIGVIATGAHAAQISEMLRLGTPGLGIRSVPCPIEPRKRYVYVINCLDGPGIDFPFLIDPTSVYCRREGLGGNFICGRSPEEHEEPDTSNLDVDYNFFDEKIWPVLANRVPAFESIKVKGAWAGYYDYNTFDQNPIIGHHPYYGNLIWACGFSGHGIQMAPAVGRAIMEIIVDGKFSTIDLSRFGWNRILNDKPYKENNII